MQHNTAARVRGGAMPPSPALPAAAPDVHMRPVVVVVIRLDDFLSVLPAHCELKREWAAAFRCLAPAARSVAPLASPGFLLDFWYGPQNRGPPSGRPARVRPALLAARTCGPRF